MTQFVFTSSTWSIILFKLSGYIYNIIYYQGIFMSFFQNNKKWAVYEDGDFNFIERGFHHHHLIKFDVRYRTNQSKVQIQQTIHANPDKNVSSSGQVKFQLPIQGTDRLLYSKFATNGKVSLLYDNGLLELKNGFKLNFYSAFQTNRSLVNNTWKFGLACIGDSFSYGIRFRYGAQQNQFLVHTKGAHNGKFSQDNWRVNFYSLFNPRISKLIKIGVLFGLTKENQSKDQFYLRVESGKRKNEGLHWCQFAQQLKFNWVRTLSPQAKIGLQSKIDSKNRKNQWSGLTFAGEWRYPESNLTVKAKVGSDLGHALSLTHKLGTYGTYSLGVQMTEVGKQNKVIFGTQLNLNL